MKHQLTSQYVVSADIGGSHITAAICNPANHSVVLSSLIRAELNSKADADEILSIWVTTLQNAIENVKLPVKGLAMAMPGPFDYQNGIAYIKGLYKYEALYGMDIKQYLADALKLSPMDIKFRNDAEATIAGEVLAGAGKYFKNVMGVTLGTGFGSGHFKNDQTIDLNLGSEPFKESIADDYLSTRWFLKRYHELTGMCVSNVQELAEIAYSNATAKEIFKEFALNMSNFLLEPVYSLKPEVLIICGNIARASGLFLPHLKKRLNINIQLAELGELAPLTGAAALFESIIKLQTTTNHA
ncbi:MAG: ROK family protein [Bacteroidota bacterium]